MISVFSQLVVEQSQFSYPVITNKKAGIAAGSFFMRCLCLI